MEDEWNAGTAVLQNRVRPILLRRVHPSEGTTLGIDPSTGKHTHPPRLGFTLSGTPINLPDEGKLKRLSVRGYFESDGTTVDARVEGLDAPFSGPIDKAEDIANKVIDAALQQYHKLRQRT